MASSGNFSTLLNGLLYQVGTNTTYSLGNTKYQSSTSGEYSQQASTIAPSSGKWYAEMYVNTVGNLHFLCLVGDIGVSDTTNRNAYPNRTTNGGMGYAHSGLVRFNGSDTSSGYSTYTDGDIIQIAFDIDNTKVWFGKNNTWQNSGDPANGTNASYTTWTTTYGTVPKHWHVGSNIANTGATTFNFGQDDTFGGVITAAGNADGNGKGVFKYSPPSGFLALCSANLSVSDDIDPAQTDDDYPGKNFNTVIYTGNGSTQSITGLGFKPDLVWLKRRDGTKANALFDSNRGVTKYLSSDSQGTGATDTSTLTTFGTDGFSLASPAANNLVNGNGFTYVGWCWKANGGTTSSDSSGDITVTRQSNTKGGFSILTYTGNGSADQTIAHGLGATPAFIITKNTSSNSHWAVWHQSHTGYYGQIEDTGSWASDSSQFYTDGMTSNFIGVKGSGATNDSGSSMLGYVWTEIDGYSKFGSYEGNNNADGPFVYTGGRPRLLMIRNTEQSSNWEVFDSARQTFNSNENYLRWNTTGAEGGTSTTFDVDFLSQGFKVRNTEVDLNNTRKYIYACWMDVPFKYNNTF